MFCFSDAKDEIDMIELMEQENDEKTEKEGGGYRNGFILIFVKHKRPLSFGHFHQDFLILDMNHDWSGGGSDEGDCRDDGAGIGQVLDNIDGEELSDPDLYSMLHPGRYFVRMKSRNWTTNYFIDQWKEKPGVYILSNQYSQLGQVKHVHLFGRFPHTGEWSGHAFRCNKWLSKKWNLEDNKVCI